MEHKDIKQLLAEFERMINTADENLAAKLIAADAIFYAPTQPEPLTGPKGYLAIVHMMRSAFSDVKWHLEDCVTEPGKIAVCWTCTGTHDGEFMGHPATGNRQKIQGTLHELLWHQGGAVCVGYWLPGYFRDTHADRVNASLNV